jgi:hypothetical protein
MAELFVFGTFWFWALVVAEIAMLFVFVEWENGVGATLSFVAFLACIQLMGDINVLAFIKEHPLKTIGGVAAYFALGACWSAVKWWIFCRNKLADYKECKIKWLARKGRDGDVIPPDLKEAWQRELGRQTIPPLVSEHKASILRWMSWWMISMVCSLLNDFMREVWNIIYQEVAAFFQRISDYVFSDVKDDIK